MDIITDGDMITDRNIIIFLRKNGYDIESILNYIYYKNKHFYDLKYAPEMFDSDAGAYFKILKKFLQYCHDKNLCEYASKGHYSICDEGFSGPGVAVFRSDDKQFFKLYRDDNYHLVAKDCNKDGVEGFREIIFQIGENDSLYPSFKFLHDTIGEQEIKTLNERRNGSNRFNVEKSKKGYNLIITKEDITYGTPFTTILIGDNDTCSQWSVIDEFYSNIKSISKEDSEKATMSKILKIRCRE